MDPVTVRRGPDGTLYTVPVDPAAQQQFEAAQRQYARDKDHLTVIQGQVAKVAAITLALGEVRALVPGYGGIAFSFFLSGTGVTAGHVPVFGPSLLSNFLPTPVGYLGESATGIPRNYYLPAGSSQFIPEFLDPIEESFGQQRAADLAARTAEQDRARLFRAASVDALTTQLPTDALVNLQAGVPVSNQTPTGRDLSVFSLTEQRASAARVLAARGVTPPTTPEQFSPLVAGLADALASQRAERAEVLIDLREAATTLDTEQRRILAQLAGRGVTLTGPTDPFGGPVAMGSTQPALQQPTSDAAIRNARQATGINRELVAERADP